MSDPLELSESNPDEPDPAEEYTADIPQRGPSRMVIVNGTEQAVETVQAIVDAGEYDVIFVECLGHAYSQIKRIQPDLVALCVDLDDAHTALQVLSMLRLDDETRDIPVITYASREESTEEYDDETGQDGTVEPLFAPRPSTLMN